MNLTILKIQLDYTSHWLNFYMYYNVSMSFQLQVVQLLGICNELHLKIEKKNF